MKFAALAAALVVALCATAAEAVVVDAGNPNGWAYFSTDNGGALGLGSSTINFVNGPATPPAGTGSLNFQTAPGHGDESAQARLLGWEGTKLSDLTTLKYSTYATAWNGQQLPYLTLYLNLAGNPNGAYDARIHFEPDYTNSASLNTWQTWNVLTGNIYDDVMGGPPVVAFASYLTANPNAVIVESAPGIGGVRITSGYASAIDNFNTNIDLVEIGTSLGTTSYNFEVAAVPEAGAFMFAGLACVTSAGITIYRTRKAKKA